MTALRAVKLVYQIIQQKIARSWKGPFRFDRIEITRYVRARRRSSEATQGQHGAPRSASRRRARSLARAATANASERRGENGDRERKGGDRSQQQAAGRAADVEEKRAAGRRRALVRPRLGEPATSKTSAGPNSRAELLEVLLRVDAEVKTMLPASLRRQTSRGSAQFATASRKRTA